MGNPKLSSKIMNASPKATGSVPNSGVEDNGFGDRTKFPKDKEILSRDSMGNKALTETYSKGRNPGVDKSFLNKHTTDMTKSLHSL